LAFPEPNLKLSDAQPFVLRQNPNPNLDKRDFLSPGCLQHCYWLMRPDLRTQV